MNEHKLHHEHAVIEANSGALCHGDDCCGWHLTQSDVFVTCACNPGGRKKPHPEDESPREMENANE